MLLDVSYALEVEVVKVTLKWTKIDWRPDDTWAKNILPKLDMSKTDVDSLKRSVYVIRLKRNFCVEYPGGTSPALYVGQGDFNQRITAHRKWVSEFQNSGGQFSFEIRMAVPRVKNNARAYEDTEAALLIRFEDIFGSLPLWNMHREKRKNDNYFYENRQIDQAIIKGRGSKYNWSLRPLMTSSFAERFEHTHTA